MLKTKTQEKELKQNVSDAHGGRRLCRGLLFVMETWWNILKVLLFNILCRPHRFFWHLFKRSSTLPNFNHLSRRKFIFKSPPPGLASLPDSGPLGQHTCMWIHVEPEESIINQLLMICYCLQSPTTPVSFNPQNNPVLRTVISSLPFYRRNHRGRLEGPRIPLPFQSLDKWGAKECESRCADSMRQLPTSLLNLVALPASLQRWPHHVPTHLVLVWLLLCSSLPLHSVSHGALSLLFQSLSSCPFPSISTVTPHVLALAAPSTLPPYMSWGLSYATALQMVPLTSVSWSFMVTGLIFLTASRAKASIALDCLPNEVQNHCLTDKTLLHLQNLGSLA